MFRLEVWSQIEQKEYFEVLQIALCGSKKKFNAPVKGQFGERGQILGPKRAVHERRNSGGDSR